MSLLCLLFHGVCSNNYFEYDTFYNSFFYDFVGFYLLWLSFIPTLVKDLNKKDGTYCVNKRVSMQFDTQAKAL